jgi:hydroxymethylpyrimidine pyrophosphatase-like HAD family hydrolase
MVGDGLNDLGAFEVAGVAIAVEGAPARVVAAADLMVGSADQGAVADALAVVLGRSAPEMTRGLY